LGPDLWGVGEGGTLKNGKKLGGKRGGGIQLVEFKVESGPTVHDLFHGGLRLELGLDGRCGTYKGWFQKSARKNWPGRRGGTRNVARL